MCWWIDLFLDFILQLYGTAVFATTIHIKTNWKKEIILRFRWTWKVQKHIFPFGSRKQKKTQTNVNVYMNNNILKQTFPDLPEVIKERRKNLEVCYRYLLSYKFHSFRISLHNMKKFYLNFSIVVRICVFGWKCCWNLLHKFWNDFWNISVEHTTAKPSLALLC